ncbi:MAG TPA: DHA2 family efflux MFS transporter permease subunit [Edaphobacter sp.]|nr:DHA2 family efflux MFS transporter permease subunit [Edaphobacter sp.]
MAAAAAAVPMTAWKPKTNPWVIAATVAMAAFMEVLDTSIANVALPYIAGGLGASRDESTWVLTTYLVANAVVLPMGGWASSVIGRKKFFMMCLIIFIAASFLCGLAPSLGLLLFFRVLQGAGGGGLQPMAQAIMADSFEPSKRGLAFSLYGLVAVLAPSIGPTIGGWLTDNYSWHWIFYINIPIGIAALFLVQMVVEDPPYLKPDRKNFWRIDYIGVILLVISMGALEIFMDKGEEWNWFGSAWIKFYAITFVVSFLTLIWWEVWGTKKPIMEMRLYRYKNFAVCSFLMLMTGGILNAGTVLQPQFTQQLLRYTATIAGLALSWGGLVLIVVMPMAGIAVSRFPARNVIVFGFILFVLGYGYSALRVNLGMSFGFASWLRVVQIAAIPFVFISVTTAAYFGIPRELNNQVAGLINFARNIGGSILISLTNAFVVESTAFHQANILHSLNPGSPAYQQRLEALTGALTNHLGPSNAQSGATARIYNLLQAQTAAQAYVDVYFALAAASAIMVLLSFLLDKNNPKAGGKTEIAVH